MLSERELVHESNKAMFWFCMWTGSTIVGLLWSIYVTFIDQPYEFIRFAIPVFQLAVSGFVAVLFAFRYARYNAMMNGDDDNGDLADNILSFNQEVTPRVHLENSINENRLLRSSYGFEPSDWRLLTRELHRNDWRWTRDVLSKTRLFPYVTRSEIFNSINSDFERMQVIAGGKYNWRVTESGKGMLREAANMSVIP